MFVHYYVCLFGCVGTLLGPLCICTVGCKKTGNSQNKIKAFLQFFHSEIGQNYGQNSLTFLKII
jgi:hypothetical protein